MAHYRVIDKASWPRLDHFTFYRTFANPSFNLCVPVEAQQFIHLRERPGRFLLSTGIIRPVARGQRRTAAETAPAQRRYHRI